jgi:ABC-2 type transport system permease protein
MMAETWQLMIRDLKKWIRTPAWLFASLIQPIIWLVLFGSAFNPANLIPQTAGIASTGGQGLTSMFEGAPNYITFLTAGMLCFLMTSAAMWAGGPLITDRALGYLDKLLAAPISRSSITLSLVFSSVIKGVILSAILFVAALLIPGGLVLSPGFGLLDLLGVFATLIALAVSFLWLFIGLAVRISKFETAAAISSTIGLPLLFASSALFPVSGMPGWLREIADINPISKAADILRLLVVEGSLTGAQLNTVAGDFVYLLAFAAICGLIGVVISQRGLRIQ